MLVDIAAAPLHVGLADATGMETDLWLRAAGRLQRHALSLLPRLNGPALYRAAIHGKKISYGYGTFFPKAWRGRWVLLGTFPNPEAMALLRSWNVRYVCVGEETYKAGLVDAPGDTWEKVQSSGCRPRPACAMCAHSMSSRPPSAIP